MAALTRKMLKGLGIAEDAADAIFEAHVEDMNGIKAERDDWKEKAATAEALKTERDQLKQQIEDGKNGTDWKAEYDKLKADTESKETAAKVKKAYRGMLKAAKVDEDMLDTIMDATRFDGMKLDKDDSLHDADKLAEDINTRWAKFIVTEGTKPTPTRTPPEGGKATRTKEEIMDIKDTGERQKAMLENHELFGF